MKTLDRLVALAMLVFSSVYAWLALDYQLLPFERNLPFKPNTLPLGLSIAGIVLSLAVLLIPHREDSSITDESVADARDGKDDPFKGFDKKRPLILVGLMIAYALCLRPVGFIIATTGFLSIASLTLGERKFHILIPVALISAFAIWYVVQHLLGVFLSPWPAGIG